MKLNLPCVDQVSLSGKRVLVRCDLDVPLEKKEGQIVVADETRLELALKTINYLAQKEAKVIVVGHLGRPKGKRVEELSLAPVVHALHRLVTPKVRFFQDGLEKGAQEAIEKMPKGEVLVLENIRFYSGEEANDSEFSRKLAELGDVFVNESFAVAHREHASIVGLSKHLPTSFGFNFCREAEVLNKAFYEPERPVALVLGGRKKGKLEAAGMLLAWADSILLGGELVELEEVGNLAQSKKVIADLTKKGEDITLESAREFAQIIKKAGTVVWSGPMGAFEDARYIKGTKVVAEAVAESKAFSIVGGGDTEAALTKLGVVEKIDFICSGGGAMLFFFALRGNLPAIKAVLEKEAKNG